MTGNWVPAGQTPPVNPSLVKLIRGEQMTPTELLEWADQLKGLGPYTLIPALAAALRRQIELTDQALLLEVSHRRSSNGKGLIICCVCHTLWPCPIERWRRDVQAAWEGT